MAQQKLENLSGENFQTLILLHILYYIQSHCTQFVLFPILQNMVYVIEGC